MISSGGIGVGVEVEQDEQVAMINATKQSVRSIQSLLHTSLDTMKANGFL